MNWETLLCLGDSITIGSRSYLGYPEFAGHYLSKAMQKSWNVINAATSSYTTIDLARYLSMYAHTYRDAEPELVTIMIGTNDLKEGTSHENFSIAYEQVILKAKLLSRNGQICLFEIPALQTGVRYPYHIAMNDLRQQFNSVISTLASQYQVRVYEVALGQDDFFDGVHLNESGCRRVGMQLANIVLADKGYGKAQLLMD